MPSDINHQYEGEFTYPTEYTQSPQVPHAGYVLTYIREITPETWNFLGSSGDGDSWNETRTMCKATLKAVLNEGRSPLDVATAITSSLGDALIELAAPEVLDNGNIAQTSFIISPIDAAGRVAVKVCLGTDEAYLALLILCPAENGIFIPDFSEEFLAASCIRKA